MLVGLKPAFFRWPGGCVVEGITLDNRFEWKKTLGDPAARPENIVHGDIAVPTVSVIMKCYSSVRISVQRQCLFAMSD